MDVKFAKWIGGALGWTLGGPIGGVVGFSLGYLWDNASLETGYDFSQSPPLNQRKSQSGDFTLSLLVLAAAVMKADNRVLKSELAYVKAFLLQQFGEQKAVELLKILKGVLEQDIPLGPVCQQINQHMPHAQRLQLVHFLIGIARADGNIDESEWRVVDNIASYLRVNNKDLGSLKAMYQEDENRHYRILEIPKEASDDELKKAYRKMAMKYHPDRLGDVGEEVKTAAQEKFQQVQEAYDKIRKTRKL